MMTESCADPRISTISAGPGALQRNAFHKTARRGVRARLPRGQWRCASNASSLLSANSRPRPGRVVTMNPSMPSKTLHELLTVAGREIPISNPRKVLFPQRLHEARSGALLPRGRGRRASRRGSGRTCWCAIPNGIDGEFFYQKRAPDRGPPWIEVVTLSFPPGAPPKKSCRGTPRRWRGWRTSPVSSSIRIRCAPTTSIIPTSCGSISIRFPASSGRIREVARVVHATLDDLKLVGWPKTSGSRGISVRADRAALAFHEVRRAALALAREVERRVPGARHQQVVEGGASRRLPRLQPERERWSRAVLGPAGAGRARVGDTRVRFGPNRYTASRRCRSFAFWL